MEKLKRVIHILIFPPDAVILITAPIAAAALICVFTLNLRDSPFAYISYLLSTYTLTIVCARVPQITRNAKRQINQFPLIHRYLTDVPFRTIVSLYSSLGINVFYTAVKMGMGIFYRSVWFITVSIYYLFLTVMRFLLLKNTRTETDLIDDLKRYRMCGILLLVMNIALSGMVVLVVFENKGYHYSGVLIYVMAAYTFYINSFAVVNLVKFRKYKSPVLSAAKVVNFAAALVSLFSLETAMIEQFGNDGRFRKQITAITGALVCILVLTAAVFMIISATVRIKKLKCTS